MIVRVPIPTILVVLAAGCGEAVETGDKSTIPPTDGDADADSDADADTETDTDTTQTATQPTCLDAGPAPIDQEAFLSVYTDKFCWVWDNGCGAGACPGIEPAPVGCTFDPVAACACLDADFRCDDGTPVSPLFCREAYVCNETRTDSGLWTETGGTGGSTVYTGSGTLYWWYWWYQYYGGSGLPYGGSGTTPTTTTTPTTPKTETADTGP